MKLNEAKKVFHQIRSDTRRIYIDLHAYDDYPERGFTEQEVIKLLSNSIGQFRDTDKTEFLGKRFCWYTKDLAKRDVKIVLELDKDDEKNFIFAISAWRYV